MGGMIAAPRYHMFALQILASRLPSLRGSLGRWRGLVEGTLGVVEVLLWYPAAEELGLRATDVDVLVQHLRGRVRHRHSLSGRDLLVDVAAGLLVDLLRLLLLSDAPLDDLLLETGDRVVGAPHTLDLLTRTVGSTRVGHGVTAVSVSHVLVDERAVAILAPLLAVLHSSLDGEDVHTVDLQTGDVLATLVVLGHGGGTASGGTHTVLVVLAAKDDRDVPELSQVERLEDLTLVGSTVSVESQGDVRLAQVHVGETNTSAGGDLSTDDTVTSVEASGEHVHGATLAVGDTPSPTEQLTNDGSHGTASHHGEAVASVGGDEVVRLLDGVLDAGGDGLLTRGQMAEPSDLLLLVQPVGGHLHPAHGHHVVVHLLQLLLARLERVRRRVQLVGLEGFVGEPDSEGLVIFRRNIALLGVTARRVGGH